MAPAERVSSQFLNGEAVAFCKVHLGGGACKTEEVGGARKGDLPSDLNS